MYLSCMYPASHYVKLDQKKVRCELCPHRCKIEEGKSGICRVRKNAKGILYTKVYGKLSAVATDPIEKKPLYHFFPGEHILSIGSAGCNLSCKFCQNYHISSVSENLDLPLRGYAPVDLLALAGEDGIPMLAYTYNEPTVFYEFMLDTARKAREQDYYNVMVSNGFIETIPLIELLEFMDAFNIDVKAYNDDFYRKITGGRLSPVLKSLETILNYGKHLEITYLIVPGLNDKVHEFSAFIDYLTSAFGPDIVLHLSRYFPNHEMHAPPTSLDQIGEFLEIARSSLHYVYPGNTGLYFDQNTYCPSCGQKLIARESYSGVVTGIRKNRCTHCDYLIYGKYK